MNLELIALAGFPVGPDFVGERRWCIEPCSSKIQRERPGDNRHLDDAQFIIRSQELGDIESSHLADADLLQPS